jgi:hypothetical protein
MNKNIHINLGYAALAVISGSAAWFTLTGDLQKHIHFAGIANEIGFTAMAGLLCIFGLIGTFSKHA